MNSSQQALYRLWYCPGQVIDLGWWNHTGTEKWRVSYERYPLTRQALDKLLRSALSLEGKPPVLTPLANELLQAERRETLLLALGLWAMKGGGALLLRQYRDSLATRLDSLILGQLQLLLPSGGSLQELTPEELPEKALSLGAAWLIQTADPALRACRLFLPPNEESSPQECPVPVLQKLVRWL